MNSWNCTGCNEGFSAQDSKLLGVNDTYIIIYECNNCKTRGYTVTKNSQDVVGAKNLKVLDKELYSQDEINKEISRLVQ